MTRVRKDKVGVRGVAPVGAIKCSVAPLLPRRCGVWSTNDQTNDGQCPKLSEIARHPGIRDALQLVDDCPPSWSAWRESVEGWIFEKEARKLERLDEGDNDTAARLGFGTGMWAEGPDIDPGIIGEPITRFWPTSISTAIQTSDLGRKAPAPSTSYVLLEDEIKRRPTVRHTRQESSCSSISSESSVISSDEVFNVWTHIMREDDDEGDELSAIVSCVFEHCRKEFSRERRTYGV